jgi:hypothetical protein
MQQQLRGWEQQTARLLPEEQVLDIAYDKAGAATQMELLLQLVICATAAGPLA